jgi:hypothetical protein
MNDVERQKQFEEPEGMLAEFGTRVVTNALAFVFVPWVVFCLVMLSFALGYHRLPVLAWLGFFATLGCSFALTRVNFRSLGKPRMYWTLLGMLCACAALVGMTLGLYYYKYGQGYYVYQASQPYTEVVASSRPGAFQDAGTITFSDSARIDTSRSVGFVDSGSMYCAAPIIDMKEMESSKRGQPVPQVGFWAVGFDCCEPRSVFWCSRVRVHDHKKTQSGLVVRDAAPLGHQVVPVFRRAVREAAAAYGLQAHEDAIMLELNQDLHLASGKFWSEALSFYKRAVLAYFGVLAVISFLTALFYDGNQRFKNAPMKR